jgi:hypothetical protein
VQWLVQIADQMEQEFECEQPFLKVRILVFQLDCELIDFIHDAGLGRPIRCQRAGWQSRSPEARNGYVRIVYFQIDEVPILGLLVMVAAIVAVSIFVRPGRLIPFPYQIDFAMYGNDVMDLTSAGLRSM